MSKLIHDSSGMLRPARLRTRALALDGRALDCCMTESTGRNTKAADCVQLCSADPPSDAISVVHPGIIRTDAGGPQLRVAMRVCARRHYGDLAHLTSDDALAAHYGANSRAESRVAQRAFGSWRRMRRPRAGTR